MMINDSSRCHDYNILLGHVYLLGEPFLVPVYRWGPAYYNMIDTPRCGVLLIARTWNQQKKILYNNQIVLLRRKEVTYNVKSCNVGNDSSRYHDYNILLGHIYLLGEPFLVPVYRWGPAYYNMIDTPRWQCHTNND